MPTNILSDIAIDQINSLGGPPLPTGVPNHLLKVMLENMAASQTATSSSRIAGALVQRNR